MMLSRTGWDRNPPLGRSQTGEGGETGGHHGDVPRVRPTGGPHLLLLLLCVCVCVCVCVQCGHLFGDAS